MEIQHFCHAHPLTLRNHQQKIDHLLRPHFCRGCEKTIWDDSPIYSCNHCKEFIFHKSCLEKLTQKIIKHPFHPNHPLTLVYNHTQDTSRPFICSACNIPFFYFGFHCSMCDFVLHIGCASMAPTISYEGHDHLLTLFEAFEEISTPPLCNSCSLPCWKSNNFRCVECDFNLHITCAPSLLPGVIDHECHLHPLTLRQSVARGGGGCRESFCNACNEKITSPNPVLYFCKECEFFAEFKCVISAVLPPLIRKQEENMKAGKTEVIYVPRDEIVATEAITDPTLAKLDAEIAKIHTRVEVLTEVLEDVKSKLEQLKVERVQYVASTKTELKEVVVDITFDADQAEGKKKMRNKKKKVLDKVDITFDADQAEGKKKKRNEKKKVLDKVDITFDADQAEGKKKKTTRRKKVFGQGR